MTILGKPVRRIVTADINGYSLRLSDEMVADIRRDPWRPGFESSEIWVHDGSDNLGAKYWYGIVKDSGAGPGRCNALVKAPSRMQARRIAVRESSRGRARNASKENAATGQAACRMENPSR